MKKIRGFEKLWKSNFVRRFHEKNSRIFKILKNVTKIKNF